MVTGVTGTVSETTTLNLPLLTPKFECIQVITTFLSTNPDIDNVGNETLITYSISGLVDGNIVIAWIHSNLGVNSGKFRVVLSNTIPVTPVTIIPDYSPNRISVSGLLCDGFAILITAGAPASLSGVTALRYDETYTLIDILPVFPGSSNTIYNKAIVGLLDLGFVVAFRDSGGLGYIKRYARTTLDLVSF